MPSLARLRARAVAGAGIASIVAALAGAPAAVHAADAAPAAATAAPERPARGMKMSQVEARYGAPSARHEAVGQPPITRWDYPGMIVFFEHDHVVHAVLTAAGG